MIKFPYSRVWAACLAAILSCQVLYGQGDDDVFTADLPFDAGLPLPAWMHGPPVSAPGEGARVAFRLSPPSGRDLLVHLIFDESNGGALRVEWLRDGSSTPEVISENLAEGIGAPNQRRLLISASNLGGNGTLLLQGGSRINVNRVKFEWVSEHTMLASSSRYVPVVVTASRLTLAETDVDGGPRQALRDEWHDQVVSAALTEKAELLTPSITLVATLEQAPMQARFETFLAGVFLDQEVWLIVNDQEVGPLAIDVPALQDPGHIGLSGHQMQFAGWRRANIHVPAEFLLPGENSVMLELRSPLNADYRNKTYLRDAVLELRYPPALREPDLSMPLRDLPSAAEASADEPLPAVVTTPASPGDALQEFWGTGGGAL